MSETGATGGNGCDDPTRVAAEADAAEQTARRAALRRRLAVQGVEVGPSKVCRQKGYAAPSGTQTSVTGGGAPDPSTPAAAPSGVDLIAPSLVARAIGGAFSGDLDGVAERPATSREDDERRQFLRRYAEAPDGFFRRHLVADDGTLARLTALAAEAPNGARAIAIVERAALLSRHAGAPLRVPPILLVGEPGTGKSRLAHRLAEALGTTLSTIDGGSTTDRGPVVGHDIGYRGAAPGVVARALLDGPTAGPMVLVNEIDKVAGYTAANRPVDALLPLLEPSTARAFTDTYVALPMRADGVVWILTANDLSRLPAPLLDRAVVVPMPRLGRDETRAAIVRLFNEILVEHGLAAAALDEAALSRLERLGLRQARRVLALALGPALAAGRPAPDTEDVARAAALVALPKSPRVPRKPPARPAFRHAPGFIRFGPNACRG